MPAQARRPADPKQRWMTFVRNHANAIIACDFFVADRATFQLVYVLVIMESAREESSISMRRDTQPLIGLCSNFESVWRAMKDTDS
jgi:hypothetical protein